MDFDTIYQPNPADDVPEGVRPEPMGLSLRMEGKYVQHGFDPARRNVIDTLVRCGDDVVFYDRENARYMPIAWKVKVQA